MTTKSSQRTTKPINLQTISLLLLSNNSIVSQLTESGIVFTASQLVSKIPSLKALGDMPLVQLRETPTGNKYRIPTLYQKDDRVVIVLPDINASITNDFEIEDWKAGDVNQAIITSKKCDVALNAAIAFTSYVLDDIRNEYNNQLEGEGLNTLKAEWLKPAPSIELPLRTLPVDVVLTIVGNDERRSKKYNTQLVDIEDSNGKLYKNVITNAELRNLIADECTQFKIRSVNTVKVEKPNSKSKKEKTRTIQKVLVEPVMSADFSDL